MKETLEKLGVDYSTLSPEDVSNIMYGISTRQAAETITTNSNNDSFNAATNNTNTLTLGNTLTTGQESNTITLVQDSFE